MRFTIGVTLLGLLASASPVKRDNITVTTTEQATITSTAHLVVTDHVTVTDHTTQIVTQTAYIIEDLPLPCGADAKGTPVTTVQPPAYTSLTNTGSGHDTSSGHDTTSSHDTTSGHDTSSSHDAPAYAVDTGNGLSNPAVDHRDELPVMKPVIPPSVNPNDLEVLKPTPENPVVWTHNGTAPDPSTEYVFAAANITYRYPTVILDQSGYISNISCNAAGLAVSFNDDKAYAFAKANWQTPFLLVTDDVHCLAADAEGTQIFWLVDGLKYDDLNHAVVVSAEEIAVKDAYNKVSLVWGTYTPDGSKPGGASWDGSSSGTPGSSTGSGSWGGGGTPSNNSPGGSTGGQYGGLNGTLGGSPSGGGSSNGTVPSSNSSCLNPPASYKGLPTAPCGDDFDDLLDAKIGFLDFTNEDDREEFGPGVDRKKAVRRSLHQHKGRWLDDVFNFIGNAVTKTKDFLVEKTEQAAQFGKDFVDLAAQLPGAAVNIAKVGYAIATGNPKFDKTFDMNAKPVAQFDSPFGKANSVMIYSTEKDEPDLFAGWKKAEIKKAISLYCVDCKSIGTTTIAGELDYDFLPFKMNKAEVSLSGSIFAQANLGVVAEGKYEKKWKKNIFTQAIRKLGFTINGIGAVGVSISMDAEVQASVGAEFKMLIGGNVTMDKFDARLDLLNDANSYAKGFNPVIKTTFDVSGEVAAKVGLSTPISIGVGVKIDNPVQYDARVALKNKPEISASVGITVSKEEETCNGGVLFKAGLTDAFILSLTESKEITLVKFGEDDNLGSKCFLLPGAKNNLPQKPDDDKPEKPAPEDPETTTPSTPPTDTDPSNPGDEDPTNPDNGESTSPEGTDPTPEDNESTEPSQGSGANDDPSSESNGSDAPAEEDVQERRWYQRGVNETVMSNTTMTSRPVSNSTATPSNSTDGADFGDLGDYDDSYFDDDDTTVDPDVLDGIAQSLNGTEEADEKAAGVEYVALIDSTGGWVLANFDDGNFFLAPATEAADWTFASDENILVGDGNDLTFFYYPDEMDILGVSRWRLNDEQHVPKSADFITMAPINWDEKADTPGVYLAFDTSDNVYYPAICSLADKSSKIFLIKDPVQGLQTLKQQELQYVVTGGVVQDCALLVLQTTGSFGGY